MGFVRALAHPSASRSGAVGWIGLSEGQGQRSSHGSADWTDQWSGPAPPLNWFSGRPGLSSPAAVYTPVTAL